jgi:hypothetical protein
MESGEAGVSKKSKAREDVRGFQLPGGSSFHSPIKDASIFEHKLERLPLLGVERSPSKPGVASCKRGPTVIVQTRISSVGGWTTGILRYSQSM